MFEFPVDEASALIDAEPPGLEPISENLYYPVYRDSIVSLTGWIEELLLAGGGPLAEAARGREKVVLVLLDALGLSTLWWHRERAEWMLHNASETRILSSVAPSTTATALVSLATGTVPAVHGVSGYRVYLKELGSIVKTFEMRHPGEQWGSSISLPGDFRLVAAETVFERLARSGVPSVAFASKYHSDSTFTRELLRGAAVVEHSSISDLVVGAVDAARELKRGLVYVYWSEIDSLSHDYGPASKRVGEAVGLASSIVRRIVEEASDEALVLVTADHGHISRGRVEVVSPSPDWLAPPFGERRLLYVLSRGSCDLDADAVRIDRGGYARLFGGEPGPGVKERFGDCTYVMRGDAVAIYPYKPEEGVDVMTGFHGGLTLSELLVPLIAF